MAGETEQKNLPPSERKLQKARERGEVASSRDFVGGLALMAGVVVIALSWPRYVEIFTSALRIALDTTTKPDPMAGLRALLTTGSALGSALLPLLCVVTLVGFSGHVLHKKGVVFSIHPIIPDFGRISPGQGFRRIASARNAWDFLIALARCSLWFTAAGLIVWFAVPGLVMAPICALPCVSTTGFDLMKTLVAVAILLVIVLGLLDLPFQTAMFRREQRMSRTEMKRELKEQQGSPEFVGHRRDRHRQLVAGGGGGLRDAAIVIVSSGEAVALRFDAVEQPVPIIVARGIGVHADPILAAARQMGTPVEVDPRLATVLSRLGVGSLVPEREFTAVATALVRHGKIG